MTRSPFTLAASVTGALPRASALAAGPLTRGAAGRFDAAVVLLDDGTKVAVRAPSDADEDAARELAAEALALRALTAGARSRLGFSVPTVLGEAGLGNARALVVDLLPGYQVDAAHIPAGDGLAPSIGRAMAAIHALPTSIVRDAGLVSRTPEESRAAVTALLDRAVATRRLPAALASRWRAAAEDDALWAFEQVVVLGSAGASSFLFEDNEAGPTVSGVLGWHALAVDDPAVDLHWLASAPTAATDVFAGYAAGAYRTLDTHMRSRARFYAELEFAKWLVHGHEVHRSDIVDDAVALLDALVAGVLDHDQPPLTAADEDLDVHEVEDLLDNVPLPIPAPNDTSFQTDAYDPEMLSLFEASERERAAEAARSEQDATADAPSFEDLSTAPIDISELSDIARAGVRSSQDTTSQDTASEDTAPDGASAGDASPGSTSPGSGSADTEPFDASDESFSHEADRASRAAFQRWSTSGQ